MDEDNKWMEELLKKEASLPDAGFSKRVMEPIPTWWKVLLRRMFIHSTGFVLGVLGFVLSEQIKLPTFDKGSELQKWQEAASNAQEMLQVVPQHLESFSEINLLTIAAILAVASVFAFTLADLPVAGKKFVMK
ncbi:MAG: hypothetical protein HYV97_17970 [Bdellovibrio sp.]|nr:hypothetical protein [Bdellovibrio sp.]